MVHQRRTFFSFPFSFSSQSQSISIPIQQYWNVAPLNLGKNKDELEKIYTFAQNMMEMDEDKRDGCDLEQFKAHQFLEKYLQLDIPNRKALKKEKL